MIECNFDGLVGQTHNYAGLSYGNVASTKNAQSISNPRLAAKQSLQKMRMLMELGIPQAVIPPQQRPNLGLLRTLGFTGTPIKMLQDASNVNRALLVAAYSASSMWTANMATVSPSCDTDDGKVHITPANLTFNLHRAQEADFSYKLLRTIFHDPDYFVVHKPLPAFRDLSDEGAANHSVLCADYGVPGLELFVYGRHGLDDAALKNKFPARQTQLASLANMFNHRLDPERAIFLQQSRAAIDAGAFHNDVVFVANKNVLFYHSQAYDNWQPVQDKIKKFFNDACYFLEIDHQDLSLQESVSTYLFNSQLLSLSKHVMALIAPVECQQSKAAMDVINAVLAADNPIKEVEFVECKQSMRNGGGPACLRLRVILDNKQRASCLQNVFLTPKLYNILDKWIDRHYRDTLSPQDLLDPLLFVEVQQALDELTQILQLGSIYPFQNI